MLEPFALELSSHNISIFIISLPELVKYSSKTCINGSGEFIKVSDSQIKFSEEQSIYTNSLMKSRYDSPNNDTKSVVFYEKSNLKM
jgi:hypothetical protein